MTHKRSILFFWALILVPALVMSGAAYRLLSHEQDRISRSAQEALMERAAAISETIHMTVDTVKDNLVRSLMAIDPGTLTPTLQDWEKTNPLVRNVFIFEPTETLLYPEKGMAATPEQQQFIARFDALFSGRMTFDHLGGPGGPEPPRGMAAGSTAANASQGDARRQLVTLSRADRSPAARVGAQAHMEMEKAADSPEQGFSSGWLPWFSENRLHVLVWVQSSATSRVYGLEVELVTLLSRLVVDFPALEDAGSAIVLTDGSGSVIHQSGQIEVSPESRPLSQKAVSSLLPHWNMEIFVDEDRPGGTRGFFYLSMILVGIFMAAILSGGILLTRMTLKNMKDARQKTSFVSSVSHELKTPLTSIRMSAELLLSGRVSDEKKKARYLSVMVSESERLTRLINNVLDFGKLEQGRKRYRLESVVVDRFLTQLIEAHRVRITAQGLRIVTQIESEDFTIRTDRDALEQVVLNLMDNVLKYAGTGEYIEFVLARKAQTVVLTICDDGPGIPKDLQEKVFDKFFRTDSSLTATQPGSGLGLSISRRILRDLGGDLHLEPGKKTGCCFTARIIDHDTDNDSGG
ncbi:MAG: HAMP domain-containing histidine kinase [Desulfotignum sp.]|nr:HAMP domain-containing histidine kinase [Desulfotignum sp.]MCF8088504.1 HAMP domain-containing histidine kinase [Desulfotignum sp.]MCF8137926.1 HAMP domain-containing histidine kinase [Desulfotignum sp.]